MTSLMSARKTQLSTAFALSLSFLNQHFCHHHHHCHHYHHRCHHHHDVHDHHHQPHDNHIKIERGLWPVLGRLPSHRQVPNSSPPSNCVYNVHCTYYEYHTLCTHCVYILCVRTYCVYHTVYILCIYCVYMLCVPYFVHILCVPDYEHTLQCSIYDANNQIQYVGSQLIPTFSLYNFT